jgi:hypothetical protein
VTRCWDAVDACGNVSDQCWQSIIILACPDKFCGFTQGFWGNFGGTFNGLWTFQLMDAIITETSPLEIGKPGHSLTFTEGTELLLIWVLPAGGTPDSMPAIGNWVVTTTNLPPASMLKNGRLTSVLVGQTISLSLNVRLDENLSGFGLCEQFETRRALPGPDGLLGTDDDVIDPSDTTGQTFYIPTSVLNALTFLGLDQTVEGLLELANCALAGLPTGGASYHDINSAVNSINRGFDKCRFVVSCGRSTALTAFQPKAASAAGAVVPTEFALDQNYPNPFNPATNISFSLSQEDNVDLSVYNILGHRVITLVSGLQPAGRYTVTWDGRDSRGNSVATGIYFSRLIVSNRKATRKMLLLK